MPAELSLWVYVTHLYGVDWLATVASVVSLCLLGGKKRSGFAVGMIAAALGVVLSVMIISLANGIASILMFGLHLRGYLLWRKTDALTRILAIAHRLHLTGRVR